MASKKIEVMMIGGEPIIGTLSSKADPKLGSVASIEIDDYFRGFALSENIAQWVRRMNERIYVWLPRYYGSFPFIYDRNNESHHPERRNGQQLEAYVPTGCSIPPEGWVIRPAFNAFDRCIGQDAFHVKGLKWETGPTPSNSGLRLATVEFTGKTGFLPLENYYKEEAAA